MSASVESSEREESQKNFKYMLEKTLIAEPQKTMKKSMKNAATELRKRRKIMAKIMMEEMKIADIEERNLPENLLVYPLSMEPSFQNSGSVAWTRETLAMNIIENLIRNYNSMENVQTNLSCDLRRHWRVLQLRLELDLGSKPHEGSESDFVWTYKHPISKLLSSCENEIRAQFDEENNKKKHFQRKRGGMSIDAAMYREFSTFLSNNVSKYSSGGHLILLDMQQRARTTVPLIRLRIEKHDMGKVGDRVLLAQVNTAFTQMFGFTGTDITQMMSNSVNGFLPYGAGLISVLAANSQEVVQFLDEQCVKLISHKFEMIIPWFGEIVNSSMITLNVKKSSYCKNLVPVKAEVTVLMRLLGDCNSFYEEQYFMFSPTEDLSHLFRSNLDNWGLH